MNQRIVQSPIGNLLLGAQDGKLVQVRLLEEGEGIACSSADDPVLEQAEKQLSEYFAGERKTFDLPLALHGTAFEQMVWQQLLDIPFGSISSYGRIAQRLGKQSASRAVGGACSRNPLLIVVPCHRVVAVSGRLTGFAAGLAAKHKLLTLEGHMIKNDCIIE